MTVVEDARSDRRPAWRAAMPALLALTCLFGLAACSSATADTTASDSTPRPAASGTTSADEAAAGKEAAAYMGAVMAGDFAAAATHVVKEQRDFVKALAMSSGPGTLLTISGHISVGKVTVTADQAAAVLVGRMCRTETGGSRQPQCVENRDPASKSPIFTVHLRRVGAQWQVALPTPNGQ